MCVYIYIHTHTNVCLCVFREEGNGYPLQYSSLENSTDREAWQATVRRVAKSRTQLTMQKSRIDLEVEHSDKYIYVCLCVCI